MRTSPNNLGLSLSGGGYRAAAFHLGTLKKLDELGILPKVNVLSTISGGSITGAYYCIHNAPFDVFETELKKIISTKSVIRYILTSFTFIKAVFFFLVFIAVAVYAFFTPYPAISVVSIFMLVTLFVLFQFKIFPVSKVIEKAYDSFFYHNATLSQLLDHKPRLAIGSTNIHTNRPFTFSKDKMEDATYAFMKPPVLFKNENFPLSRAVMASSCVPFAFTPVSISREFYENEEDINKVFPVLVDGGVFDNQGIHKITQRHSSYECDVIITSDAGNKSPFKKSYNNAIVLLIRVMDVFMARIKNFQMIQNLYTNTDFTNKQVAYLSLGWDIHNCIPGFIDNLRAGQITESVIDSHKIPAEWVKNVKHFREQLQQLLEQNVNYKKIESQKLTDAQLKIARSVGTNLSCLSAEQVDCLSGHAANITELQVKLYCPSLISE